MSNKHQLDPDPDNILGKGVLPPDVEQGLLERGIVFAQWSPGKNAPPFLITSHAPIDRATAHFFQYLWDGTVGLNAYRVPSSAVPIPI